MSVDYSKLPDHIDDVPDHLDTTEKPVDPYNVITRDEVSPLDSLRQAINKRNAETVRYAVPDNVLQGDWSLEFSTRISTAELNGWRKRAQGKRKDDVDAGRLNALVLAHKNVAMYQGGKKVTDDDGDAVTLTSQEILDLTDTRTAVDAILTLLGDGYVSSLGDEIITAAGFGQDVPEDPTGGSSSRG